MCARGTFLEQILKKYCLKITVTSLSVLSVGLKGRNLIYFENPGLGVVTHCVVGARLQETQTMTAVTVNP